MNKQKSAQPFNHLIIYSFIDSFFAFLIKAKIIIYRYGVLKILTFLAIFLFSLKGLYGEDIWFHLAIGQYVFEHRTIPLEDVFSFTAEGKPWVNQNWLADLVFYGVLKIFGGFEGLGGQGLAIFFSFLFLAVFLVLWGILKEMRVAEGLRLILTFWAAFLAVGRFQARPEPGSYLLFMLVLFCLFKFGQSKKIILFLPLIFLIWANWQAGFVPFGIFAVGVMGPSALLRVKGMGIKGLFSQPIFWAGILSLLAILINPNGIAGITYFLQVQPKYLVEDFTEWGSLLRIMKDNRFTSLISEDKLQIVGYPVYLLVFLTILFLWLRSFYPDFKKLRVADICILLLGLPFIFLPFFAHRFIAAASIFMAILVGYFFSTRTDLINIFFLPPSRPRTLFFIGRWRFIKTISHNLLNFGWQYLTRRNVVMAMALISIIMAWWRLMIFPPTISSFQKANPWRNEALEFINRNKLEGNIFNPLEDGGYFLWREPKRKVFMDGRLDVYTQSGVYEDYKKIYSFPPKENWQEVLKKYQIEMIFLSGWQKEPMATIRNSGLYDLVYWSDYLFILLKNEGVNKEFAEKDGILIAEPFKEGDYPKEKLEKAIADFQKLKEISPRSSNVATALASAYQEKGQIKEAVAEYERSLSLKPDDGMVRLAVGNLYFTQGQCEKAESHFQLATQRGGTVKVLAYRNLGFVYYQCLGNFPLASYHFKKFLSLAKGTSLGKNTALMEEAKQLVRELQIRAKRGY